MKVWKAVAVAVVVLLVVAVVLLANYALEDKDAKATKARIKTYRIVAEEQGLIRQILEDKIVVARIQAQIVPKDPNSP